jgi:hypothetical protein
VDNFRWIDRGIPDPSSRTFRGWGTFQGPGSKPEPDNRFTNELCTIANWTERTGPAETPYWGWDDKQCGRNHTFMCRIIRKFVIPAIVCLTRPRAVCAGAWGWISGVPCTALHVAWDAHIKLRVGQSRALMPTFSCCAAPQTYNYTSQYTGNTYILSTFMQTQQQAQVSCNAAGGHLASWVSKATAPAPAHALLHMPLYALPSAAAVPACVQYKTMPLLYDIQPP